MSQANEELQPKLDKASFVPRVSGVVYLYELQTSSHNFCGFNMEELNVLAEAFPIISMGPEVGLIKQGDQASFVAILLKGSGQSYQKGRGLNGDTVAVVDYFEPGSFIGQNAFFTSGNYVEHPHNVKVTGCVNVMMLVTHDQLANLNDANPHIGNRVVRLIAEAASCRIYAPAGSPPLPELESVPTDARENMKDALLRNKNDNIVTAMSDAEIDILLDHAGILRVAYNQQVFWAGHQAHMVLLLLTGGLETRGTAVRSFTEPGDVVGETMFPFVTHKHDAFATQDSEFMSFTSEGLYKLNLKHPTVGLKLTKNIIQHSLKKMHKTFRPGAVAYDPEKREMSRMEKEMADLRWVSSAGLQQLLRETTLVLDGPNAVMDDHNYEGKGAVNRLSELINQIARRQTQKDQDMTEMVKVKDYRKMVASLERNFDNETKLKSEIKAKVNRIDTLDFKVAELEQQAFKLHERIEDKNKEIEELETELETEKETAKQRYKVMYDENAELKKRVKDEDPGIMVLMKQQSAAVDQGKIKIKELEDLVLDLRYSEENLKKTIGRMEKEAELQELRTKEEEQDNRWEDNPEDDEGDGLADESIPRLQMELSQAWEKHALLRWKTFTILLKQKHDRKPMLSEVISSLVKHRNGVKELTKYKGISEDLQAKVEKLEELNKSLQGQLDLVKGTAEEVQKELEKRYGELEKFPEVQMFQMRILQMEKDLAVSEEERISLSHQMERSKDTVRMSSYDVDKLSNLSTWLVEHILRNEASEKGGTRIIWRKNEVELLKTCWSILKRRNHLQPPLVNIDMDQVTELLLKRGAEEFQNFSSPIPGLPGNRDSDGMADILAAAAAGYTCDPEQDRFSPKEPIKKNAAAVMKRSQTLQTPLMVTPEARMDSDPVTKGAIGVMGSMASPEDLQTLRKGSVPLVGMMQRSETMRCDQAAVLRRGSDQPFSSSIDLDGSLSLADKMRLKGVVVGIDKEIEDEVNRRMSGGSLNAQSSKGDSQERSPVGIEHDAVSGIAPVQKSFLASNFEDGSTGLAPPRTVSLGNLRMDLSQSNESSPTSALASPLSEFSPSPHSTSSGAGKDRSFDAMLNHLKPTKRAVGKSGRLIASPLSRSTSTKPTRMNSAGTYSRDPWDSENPTEEEIEHIRRRSETDRRRSEEIPDSQDDMGVGLHSGRRRRIAQTMHVVPVVTPVETQVRFAPKRVNPSPAIREDSTAL